MKDWPIAKAFSESGNYDLMPEFIETLVNDTELPEKLRRQIWSMVSTTFPGLEQRCADVVASFQDSEDAGDLKTRWQSVVDVHWAEIQDCPLKREIDALGN